MKALLALSVALLAAGSLTPSLAQPLRITVPGGIPVTLPSHPYAGEGYTFDWRDQADGDNFDPAAAAIDATNAAFPRRPIDFPVNIDLAGELAVYRGSWTRHIEACQARFPSYDLVSDTILVDGLPVPCPY
jgi:hypothetical protein